MVEKPSYRELERKIKILEQELAGHHSIEKLLWEKQDQLFKILDSLDAIVYVADMDTYEILFANRYTEKFFGQITGKICWQVLQSGMTGPCEFCTNEKLVTPEGNPGETVAWEMQNSVTGQWLSIRDKAIEWHDGRIVHLQIAVDLTDRKQIEAALQESEVKFRMVADFTYDWEYWINPEGAFNYISPSCERITGYTAREFEKNPQLLRNIVHPDDRQAVCGHLDEELESSGVCHLNFRIMTKDGELCWISHYCQQVYNHEKRFLGRRASNRDITAQKRAEEKIKINEMRMAAVLDLYEKEALPDAEICDYVLEASLPLTGSGIGFLGFLSQDESRMTINAWSKSVMNRCAIHDKPIVFNIAESGVWGDAVRKRRPIIINDYKSLRSKKGYPPGHVNIERFMAVPLFDEGKIVAVAAAGNKAEEYVDHDVQQLQLLLEGMWQIIKRKRVEEEFNSQARMITTFTNSVAHDLKNPALAIHGLARVLKEKHKNLPAEKLVNFIDQIAKSAEQIIALSEDINSYISSRDAPLHIKDLDLHQIWQTIREEFVPQLRKREISWHEMEGAIPKIRADRNSLLRVFRNLVDNALKYGGSNLSELTLMYDFSGTHHILGVANNGKPIPVSEVESIFDIFTRSGDEFAPAGTGLGLAIVREIARHHGGDSWVETGGSCTTFYISISRNL